MAWYAVAFAHTTPAMRRAFKAQALPDLKQLGQGPLAFDVANEVGPAHGAHCPTYLLMRTDAGSPPSKAADPAVMRYDPAARGWPDRQVGLLASFVARHWRACRASISHEGLIHGAAQRPVQMLPAAGEPVPEALLALAPIQR